MLIKNSKGEGGGVGGRKKQTKKTTTKNNNKKHQWVGRQSEGPGGVVWVYKTGLK